MTANAAKASNALALLRELFFATSVSVALHEFDLTKKPCAVFSVSSCLGAISDSDKSNIFDACNSEVMLVMRIVICW